MSTIPHDSQLLDPCRGGCWFCCRGETDAFDGEFDTNLHIRCLREALKKNPDDSEACCMTYLLEGSNKGATPAAKPEADPAAKPIVDPTRRPDKQK